MGKNAKNKKQNNNPQNKNRGGSSMQEALKAANIKTTPPVPKIDPNKEFTGTVKFFNIAKGYGFITDGDGKDNFVHFSGIENGRTAHYLKEGDTVSFHIEKTADGKNTATKVNIVEMVEDTEEESEEGPEQTETAQ